MYMYQCWVEKRFVSRQAGASVLAALMLVAILGVILVLLQFVRSSDLFAYQSEALVAASGSVTTVGTPSQSTGTCDYKTQSCSCNSDEKNQTSGLVTSATQQCLPGCTYNISATDQVAAGGGTIQAAKITSSGMSSCTVDSGTTGCDITSLTEPCNKQYTDPDGNPIGQSSASSPGSNLATQAITNAPNQTLANGLGIMYASYNPTTDPGLQDLQSQLNGYQVNQTPYSTTQDPTLSSNALAGLQAISANPTCDYGTSSSNCPSGVPQTLNPDLTSNQSVTAPTQTQSDPESGAAPANTTNDSSDSFFQTCLAQAGSDPASCAAAQKAQDAADDAAADKADTFNSDNDAFQACLAKAGADPASCKAAQTPGPGTGGGGGGGGGGNGNNNSGLGNLGSIGISFLTGLIQGISRGIGTQQAAQAAQAAQQAAAPYGVGNNGLACPPPQPQPSPSACTVGTWQQQYQSNNCPASWQCVPNNSQSNTTQPTAQLSCQPPVADVGMSVTMSYSCGNATGSSGSGFSTNNQLSGSVTASIAQSTGAQTATYVLTCTNQAQTASAQCGIQVNSPKLALTPSPAFVTPGGSAAVGWVTSGMKSCTISSPDSAAFTSANASNTSVNGSVAIPSLTATMNFLLTCQTLGGQTMSTTTQIAVGGGE